MNVSDKVTPSLLVSFLVFLAWLLVILSWNCSRSKDDEANPTSGVDVTCDCDDHFIPYNVHVHMVCTGCTWHGVRLRRINIGNGGKMTAREMRAKWFAISLHLLMLTACFLLYSPTLYNCYRRHIEMEIPDEIIHIPDNVRYINRVFLCHGG